MSCFGCKLANKKEPVHVVYENEYVCCFLDHSPYNEGHVLIMPKKHARYMDDLDWKTAEAIMKASMLLSKAIKSVFNPDGITVCQNGGAFDELTHFHMHLVPRYEGQNFAEFYMEDEDGVVEDEGKLVESKRRLVEVIQSGLVE